MIETRHLVVGSALIGFVAAKLPVAGKTAHTAKLTASADNTAPVYISNNPLVSWTGDHEGYALHPSQSADFAVETLGDLFAISCDLDQKLSWAIL